MASLLLAIVSIAVVVLAAMASIFYGGDIYQDANERVQAVSLVQQGQQLLGAAELFQTEHRRWPVSLQELEQNGHLKRMSHAAGLSESFAMYGWTMATPGIPVFVHGTVKVGTCQEVNRLSMSLDAIPTAARATVSTQCIGKSTDQLLVIASRSHADLRVAADSGGSISPDDIWPAALPYPDQPQYWLVQPPEVTTAAADPNDDLSTQQTAVATPQRPAQLSVSDLSISFRDTATHTDATRTLVLANSGDLPLTIDNPIALTTAEPFSLSRNTCGAALQAGQYCSLEIRFSPLSAGNFSTSLLIPNQGLLTVPVSGRAFNPLSLAKTDLPAGSTNTTYPPVDFKTLLSSSPGFDLDKSKVNWSVTSGALPVGMTLDASSGFLGGTPTQPTETTGKAFTVQAAYGSHTALQNFNLIITSATATPSVSEPAETPSPPEPPATVAPPSPGVLVLSDTALSFGSTATNSSSTRSLSLNNAGGSSLQLGSDIALQGSATFSISQNGCPAELLAGSSCNINLTFSPQSTGTFSATLVVNVGQQHSVTLTATAFNPVSLKATNLPAGTRGQPYGPFDLKTLLEVSNENLPDTTQATWAIASGKLPDGIALDSTTGLLQGTPTQSIVGNAFTLAVTYKSNTALRSYDLVVVSPPLDVIQISAGAAHTCAVTATYGLKCWGSTLDGRLGRGPWPSKPGENIAASPVQVLGLESDVKEVSAGWTHSCAVTNAGKALCWGGNYNGQLGNGLSGNQLSPVGVIGLSTGVKAISAGAYHSCALLDNGTVRCWGQNDYGELGDGSTTDRTTPVQVASLTNVVKISAGERHTCVLTSSGSVMCWGVNTYGQLGDGTQTFRTTPAAVTGLGTGVADISAGGYHTCAVLTTGEAKCWGWNQYGQLGDTSGTMRTTAAAVQGLQANISKVAVGQMHSCAITKAGAVMCWGSNSDYRLGRGPSTNAPSAAQVTGLATGVQSISAGMSHTCVVLSGQKAMCWGDNTHSQLGDGTKSDAYRPRTVVN